MRSIASYADHFGNARGRYRIHSPFVYELLVNTIRNKEPDPALEKVEKVAAELRKDPRKIEVKDMGAGSKWASGPKRSIASIAGRSGTDRRFGRMLFRLAQRFGQNNVLELGSSLGIGTMCLAAGSKGNVHSIEACPASVKIAEESIERSDLKNVEVHHGSFQDELPHLMERESALDLIRIDGDHREEATVEYFRKCLEKAHNDSLFIIDDIHWSKGMERAWDRIRREDPVTLSLDLFQAGLLFLRKEQKERMHLKLRWT